MQKAFGLSPKGFLVFSHEENGMVVEGQAYGQYWMHIVKLDWQG